MNSQRRFLNRKDREERQRARCARLKLVRRDFPGSMHEELTRVLAACRDGDDTAVVRYLASIGRQLSKRQLRELRQTLGVTWHHEVPLHDDDTVPWPQPYPIGSNRKPKRRQHSAPPGPPTSDPQLNLPKLNQWLAVAPRCA